MTQKTKAMYITSSTFAITPNSFPSHNHRDSAHCICRPAIAVAYPPIRSPPPKIGPTTGMKIAGPTVAATLSPTASTFFPCLKQSPTSSKKPSSLSSVTGRAICAVRYWSAMIFCRINAWDTFLMVLAMSLKKPSALLSSNALSALSVTLPLRCLIGSKAGTPKVKRSVKKPSGLLLSKALPGLLKGRRALGQCLEI